MNIGIDHGYYAIKTRHCSFPAGLTAYPDCPSVEQMSDKNKDFADATREELISRGYTPCGRCDP